MLLSIKTKLKLNDEQHVMMAKHAGIARFTFNWGLATWNDLYKSGLKPNKYFLKKFFNNHLKPEYPWIKEKGICQKITQYEFDNLGAAFQNFFKKKADYPRFKKKGKRDSFTIDAGGKPIAVGGTRVKLPTIGWVRTYEGLPHMSTKKMTISRQADDWYIAFAFEVETPKVEFKHEGVGVDLGIKELATLSTEKVFPNPKALRRNECKLKQLQRSLSRKQKGSKNREKAKMRLARQHRRVSNIRNDSLHKITNYLSKNHAKIVIEDLNVSGMLKNHKLAKAIADCGFYEFKRQLEYKTKKFGSKLKLAPRFYPSSKTCSKCNHVKEKLSLSERTFECENCGFKIDRDLNASINLSHLA